LIFYIYDYRTSASLPNRSVPQFTGQDLELLRRAQSLTQLTVTGGFNHSHSLLRLCFEVWPSITTLTVHSFSLRPFSIPGTASLKRLRLTATTSILDSTNTEYADPPCFSSPECLIVQSVSYLRQICPPPFNLNLRTIVIINNRPKMLNIDLSSCVHLQRFYAGFCLDDNILHNLPQSLTELELILCPPIPRNWARVLPFLGIRPRIQRLVLVYYERDFHAVDMKCSQELRDLVNFTTAMQKSVEIIDEVRLKPHLLHLPCTVLKMFQRQLYMRLRFCTSVWPPRM
jgi:hypothetical protein